MKEKILFTWSGGKDSTMALYELKKAQCHNILALLTTTTEDYERISMHGVRNALLEKQAKSLGIPLEKISIAKEASNEEYEKKLSDCLLHYQSQGVSSVVFGDIFLEDVRRYREENLAQIGMKGIFPIWERKTVELSRTFIQLGFKAVITCVDSSLLDGKFVGRLYDSDFLSELPPTIDPCGENGEFHSFVYDGPVFQKRVLFKKGEVLLRDDRFYFCDLIP